MIKRSNPIAMVLAAFGLCAVTSPGYAEYKQTRCEIGAPAEAIIRMSNTEGDRPGSLFYISFQPHGILVRFPPRYFAPDWEDTEVIVEYSSNDAPAGTLKLRLRGLIGVRYLKTIGTVQRRCWDQVKMFIEQNIASNGITVHLSEIVLPSKSVKQR